MTIDIVTKLQQIIEHLGPNWVYHSLKSAPEINQYYLRSRDHFAGIWIWVLDRSPCNKLPEFTIGYFEPGNHGRFKDVATVGCSLFKPAKTIAVDLQKRLIIPNTAETHVRLNRLKNNTGEQGERLERIALMWDSFKRVIDLGSTHHRSHVECKNIFPKNQTKPIGQLSRVSRFDETFSLTLNDLSTEQVFRILNSVEALKND